MQKRRERPVRRDAFKAPKMLEELRHEMRKDKGSASLGPGMPSMGRAAGEDDSKMSASVPASQRRPGSLQKSSTLPALVKDQLGRFASKAPVIKAIHQQTRHYAQQTHGLRRHLAAVNGRLDRLKGDLEKYRADIGGMHALKQNAQIVGRSFRVLENRLARAQEILTKASMDNKKAKESINEWRRANVVQTEDARAARKELKRT